MSREHSMDLARRNMVEYQLRTRSIRDERVLLAMEKIPRHEFIPENLRSQSYEDHPVPIGEGQTISQPYIIAYMTELLELKDSHKVLEVGTGSGYQTAILAELCKNVWTIELSPALSKDAEALLTRLGYEGVRFIVGNGYFGYPSAAPYDAIIVTAAPESVPEALIAQLAEGGRLVIPVGPRAAGQTLYKIVKTPEGLRRNDHGGVIFVPLRQAPSRLWG
jgi:protein-L-isoaspartate(D-aspartate) O-methyltransferase